MRRELWPEDPDRLFTVAQELALATQLLASLNHTGMTSDECAKYAFETLQQAMTAGLQPPNDLYQHAPFKALKGYQPAGAIPKS